MGGKIIKTDDFYYLQRHRSAQRKMMRRLKGFLANNKIDTKILVVNSSHDSVIDSGWFKGYTVRQLIEAYARITSKQIRYE